MPRKPSLDGKDSSLRIRMSPEQKEKLVFYAERHYQTMSNVIFQALDILYAREKNNKIIKSKMELFWSLFLHFLALLFGTFLIIPFVRIRKSGSYGAPEKTSKKDTET